MSVDDLHTCPVCYAPRHRDGNRWWCRPGCSEWGKSNERPGAFGLPVKTDDERDQINARVDLARLKDNNRKLDILTDLLDRGLLTRDLLAVYGHSEWSRGWDESYRDSNIG